MSLQQFPIVRDNSSGRGGDVQGGNDNERLEVRSGAVVFIDQFMLGNRQLIDRLRGKNGATRKLAINDYGGCVVDVPIGSYRVFRDPMQAIVVFSGVDQLPNSSNIDANSTPNIEGILALRGEAPIVGKVFVDTRCFVCADEELLNDEALLQEYQQLRSGGQEKAARDLLRSRGAAVRYGFRRFGDELAVFLLPDSRMFGLWSA